MVAAIVFAVQPAIDPGQRIVEYRTAGLFLVVRQAVELAVYLPGREAPGHAFAIAIQNVYGEGVCTADAIVGVRALLDAYQHEQRIEGK